MRVLSIDAWADCCGCDHTEESKERCWTWNNWHKMQKTECLPKTVSDFFDMMIAAGYFDPRSIEKIGEYEIDDDQYNIVLIEAKTRRPLFAVEYGAAS